MTRTFALAPIVVLAGLPVLTLPTPGMAGGVALAAVLCAAGALARLRPLVTAGGSLALILYAFGLWLTGAPPRPVGAAIFGVALALALDGAEIVHRFQGATLAPSAMRRHGRYCLVAASSGALVTLAVASLAAAARLAAAPATLAIMAAAGALCAVVGLVGALYRPSGGSG